MLLLVHFLDCFPTSLGKKKIAIPTQILKIVEGLPASYVNLKACRARTRRRLPGHLPKSQINQCLHPRLKTEKYRTCFRFDSHTFCLKINKTVNGVQNIWSRLFNSRF